MSASHRSLARLPISIFQGLVLCDNDKDDNNDSVENGGGGGGGGDDDGQTDTASAIRLRARIFEKLQSGISVQTWITNSSTSTSGRQDPSMSAGSSSTFNSAIIKIKTVRDYLFLPTYTVLCALDPLLTHVECLELERRISQCIASSAEPTTAWELFQRQQQQQQVEDKKKVSCNTSSRVSSIPTGIVGLDQLLRPWFYGLPCGGGVIEVVGAPGTGKSQLAFQLCLQTVQGCGGSAIYIDTECKASRSRWKEMAQQQLQIQHDKTDRKDQELSLHHVLDQIQLESPQTSDELIQTTLVQVENDIYHSQNHLEDSDLGLDTTPTQQQQQQQRRRQNPVRLLVLDSIAAPFRRRSSSSDPNNQNHASFSSSRANQQLMQIAQTLKRLAHQLDICVVVLNQVGNVYTTTTADDDDTGDVGREGGHDDDCNYDDDGAATVAAKNNDTNQDDVEEEAGRDFKAALGTAWYHCVSMRILLEQQQQRLQPLTGNGMQQQQQPHRRATVIKSNLIFTPSKPVSFAIVPRGLVGC